MFLKKRNAREAIARALHLLFALSAYSVQLNEAVQFCGLEIGRLAALHYLDFEVLADYAHYPQCELCAALVACVSLSVDWMWIDLS